MNKKIKNIIHLHTSQFAVKWRLTECCNYHCSYCCRERHWISMSQLKNDVDTAFRVLPKIVEIIKEKNVPTRVEFIGGEATLFDLGALVRGLHDGCGGLIKRISLVTNLSQPADYYNNLINLCKQFNIDVSLQASFHDEMVTLDSFINKVSELDIKGVSFKIETVSVETNGDVVNEFINKCSDLGYVYQVDGDWRNKDTDHVIITTSEKKENRYKVMFDEGESEYFRGAPELIKKYGDGGRLTLNGYLCSYLNDVIKIEGDKYIGYKKGLSGCRNLISLDEYEPIAEPLICESRCTLCGGMSIFKDLDEFNKYNKN